MPGVVAAERGVRGEDISTGGEEGDYGEDSSLKRDIMVRIPVGRGRLWDYWDK